VTISGPAKYNVVGKLVAQISSETVWIGNARECKETYVPRGASSSPGIERSMNAPRERSGGRKRKRDARLWDVVVNNDDICFTHILPRLNRTDVKFLFGVNGETRKLIKRSSRKGELKKKFKIEEMSSISTLELAWEHCPWGTLINYNQRMNETYFCWQVAQTNKLELLEWIREEKKCDWNSRTINVAARQGNLEMVKYCVANECPVDEWACACAAENGRLEVLKYLHEEVKEPCDATTAYRAASNGHLHILEYLVERKYDQFDVDACRGAAMEGQLDCLKYLRETAKAPWDLMAVYFAYMNNHPECVQYLLDNNCPIPNGWRYEDGKLHVPESDSESDSESELDFFE
jgi:hypothetical protein